MQSLTAMSKAQLLELRPNVVTWRLRAEEVLSMARELGAFWEYDYQAAKEGRVGMHASMVGNEEVHTDGFLFSGVLLAPQNIRTIIAMQMVRRYNLLGRVPPNLVEGIPNGAKSLGEEIARIMGVESVGKLVKQDGEILLTGLMPSGKLLLVEDFSTRGAGFEQVVGCIKYGSPSTGILPLLLTILNRGCLQEIVVDGRPFRIISLVKYRIEDWPARECPLCKLGSVPIRPKENWQKLVSSQLS